ncbi:MAG TPA: hydroxymethylbilane synthase, partial [Polyangiaceae bacterium]
SVHRGNPMTMTLVVATRRSLLALTQTRAFVTQLMAANPGLDVTELHVTTTGDVIQDQPLANIGGKGLFVKEIEQALIEGRADFAVHSMKDMPPRLAEGLTLSAIPPREDARDVAIGRSTLELLPHGAKIGTSSLRRQVQITALRPDLQCVPLRGNVDTRIRRCNEGVVDAILLAAAGLARLGWLDRVTQYLPTSLCLPAVGQGALAIESRSDDPLTRRVLESMHDTETSCRVMAERGVQRAIGGNCEVPLGAHAERIDGNLLLRGMLADAHGGLWRSERSIPWPADERDAAHLGEEMGRYLLEKAQMGVLDCAP